MNIQLKSGKTPVTGNGLLQTQNVIRDYVLLNISDKLSAFAHDKGLLDKSKKNNDAAYLLYSAAQKQDKLKQASLLATAKKNAQAIRFRYKLEEKDDAKKMFAGINVNALIADYKRTKASWYPIGFPVFPTIKAAKKLNLYLTNLHCVDETNELPNWVPFNESGSDEIVLGGTAILSDAETGTLTRYSEGGFDDNDWSTTLTGSNERLLYQYSLATLQPGVFSAAITLIEEDEGGASKILADINDAVGKEIKKALEELGKVAGAAIATVFGGGEAVKKVLGEILAWILGSIFDTLIGGIINALHDDYIDTQTATVTLPSFLSNFSGSNRSSEQKLTFSGGRGKYEVYYQWELVF